MVNGYANYQTWAAALWLENTEADYNHYRGVYETLAARKEKGEAISSLASIIRKDVEGGSPLHVGLYADLLNAAISEINFREVAERFADENLN